MALPEQAAGRAQPAGQPGQVTAVAAVPCGRVEPEPARAPRLLQGPGGAKRGLAGPAAPGRADRLLAAAIGAGSQRVLPAEQPARPAQPAGQPGQVPAVTAGAGGLISPGVAGAAAPSPQPLHLLAALAARPGAGGRPPLAPFAPVTEVDRAQLTAAGADDQPGQRQPVAAGAQPSGQMPAGLPAARAGLNWVLGAGIAAFAQPRLGSARPDRPACGAGDDRPGGGAHTGGSERPPRRAGRIAKSFTAGAGWLWWPAGVAASGSRTSSSPGSQPSTPQMMSRSSRRIEIGRPDHRCDIFPAEISRPAPASSRRRSEDRQMPRWAAASRRFHCMPLLLEPGGGPLGRLLVGAFDRPVVDVDVADRGGQPPVTQKLLDR